MRYFLFFPSRGKPQTEMVFLCVNKMKRRDKKGKETLEYLFGHRLALSHAAPNGNPPERNTDPPVENAYI